LKEIVDSPDLDDERSPTEFAKAQLDVSSVAAIWGLRHAVDSLQGPRPTHEDEWMGYDHICLHPKRSLNDISSPIAVYGVFDGHGGRACATFAKQYLVAHLVQNLEAGQPPEDALAEAFRTVDTNFLTETRVPTSSPILAPAF
jgi:hypothetical protein